MKQGSIICALLTLATPPALAQTDITFTSIHALPSNQVELMWSSDTNRLFAVQGTSDLHVWDNAFCAGIFQPSVASETYRGICTTDINPCFFRVFASPPLEPLVICHANIGTASNNTQIVIGTPGREYVIQFGEAGNDVQYASVNDGQDWTAQFGGTGSETQKVQCGSGDDWAYQDAGDGDDVLYVHGSDGNDLIVQKGAEGADDIWSRADEGDDTILQWGGGGDDTFKIEGGPGDGDDRIDIFGDDGQDTIAYELGGGTDTTSVDGGAHYDTLEVSLNGSSNVWIKLSNGSPLYSNGSPNTVITVLNLEYICVVPTNGGTVVWSWP